MMEINSNPATRQPFEPGRCPLCGNPNRCALAADPTAKYCWCELEEFPQELLAKIPKNAQRRVCVCQDCLKSYFESDSKTVKNKEK